MNELILYTTEDGQSRDPVVNELFTTAADGTGTRGCLHWLKEGQE